MTSQVPHSAIDLTPVAGEVARLHDYFGTWAVEPTRFFAAWNRVSQMNLPAHVQVNTEHTKVLARPPLIIAGPTNGNQGDNIAVIQAVGTLMKQASSLEESTSTVALRRQIRQAVADPTVGGIILSIDSPGGTSAGTASLAMDVRRAAAIKPTWAFVDDLAASAAYWIASQADRIDANDHSALVGSIGTIIGLWDISKWADKQGIEAVVVATGELKGTAFPGTEITDAQRHYLQGLVDDVETSFESAVAAGRGIDADQVRRLATGQVYPASTALKEKLIDGIRSLDEVVAEMRNEITRRAQGDGSRSQSKETIMADATNDAIQRTQAHANNPPAPLAEAEPSAASPAANADKAAGGEASPPPPEQAQAQAQVGQASVAATLAQLKAQFPDASADFRESCLEQGLTLEQASTRRADDLAAQLEAERAKTADLEQRLGQRRADRGGDKPMPIDAQGGEESEASTKRKRSMGPAATALAPSIRIAGR